MKQFFKQTFASFIGTLAGLFLVFMLGTSGLILLIVSLSSKNEGASVKDKSMLTFDLSMPMLDTQPPSSLSDVLVGEATQSMTLRQVIDSIDKATKDRRIVGIFLDGRNTGATTGYASLSEVRAALERFKATGKKIIAYDVDTEAEYYLASLADTIVLNPLSVMTINGFSSESLFLGGALEKYGIGVQVVRVGSYKGAVETFTRKNLSKENREQIQVLLSDLWGEFLQVVGESRKVTPEKLQAIANTRGSLSAVDAQKQGLIDKVAYLDEVVEEIKKITSPGKEDESFAQVNLVNYVNVRVSEAPIKSSENKIALVYAEGEIVNGEGETQQIGGDRLAKKLRELREDKSVKAVVLRINSPGGSATASDVILRELQLIKKEKPVIVSMGNIAASGGYWIATGSNYIFAEENTITGSIGVFGLLLNFEKLANNNGVTWDVVKTGSLADLDTNYRPKTEAELKIYQQYVNQIYELFLEKVATSRNLEKSQVAEIAQGRVWSGKQALAIGLVDKIGGLDEAIKYAAQQAKLGDDWEIKEVVSDDSFEGSIFQRLLTEQEVQVANLDPLTKELLRLRKELATLEFLNDPKSVYARLPFNFRIE